MKETEEDKREAKWQAEDDARLLTSYQELQKDTKRLEKAKAELKRKAEEIQFALKGEK